MVFKNNNIQLLIRLLILTAGIFLLIYSLLILENMIRSFFSVALCIISIAELFHFINKTNRDFKSFISALIYEDFTNFYSKSTKQQSDVYALFNKLNDKYKAIAYEKEVQHALLQTIIKNINIGIIVVDKNGKTLLANEYLLSLLKLNKIESINRIAEISSKLKEEIDTIEVSKPKLTEIVISGEIFRLSINAINFKLDGVAYQLISLQNINYELDEQEIMAWQKLIRVLTHEIMNSVTPISSLTSSLNGILTKAIKEEQLNHRHIEYLSNGLNAVQDRSEGLLKFTEAYKKLTQLQHPEFVKIQIEKLFEHVILLHKSKTEELRIKTTITFDKDIDLLADKSMIEQVLINLVNNSIQALENINQPKLELKAYEENNRIIIQVIDNGGGIPDDKIDKIFIPFYTTKEKGSGIGLSFVRQVMRLHKGTINVKSAENITIFTLKF